jgi:hypothetical protein
MLPRRLDRRAHCLRLCAVELKVFQLGPDVGVEPTEHIQAGARRCAYRLVSGLVPCIKNVVSKRRGRFLKVTVTLLLKLRSIFLSPFLIKS